MATIGGFRRVPKPLVLCSSTTALPEKIASSPSSGIATGRCFQCTRSRLTAWPHDMWPHVFPNGLCW